MPSMKTNATSSLLKQPSNVGAIHNLASGCLLLARALSLGPQVSVPTLFGMEGFWVWMVTKSGLYRDLGHCFAFCPAVCNNPSMWRLTKNWFPDHLCKSACVDFKRVEPHQYNPTSHRRTHAHTHIHTTSFADQFPFQAPPVRSNHLNAPMCLQKSQKPQNGVRTTPEHSTKKRRTRNTHAACVGSDCALKT